MKELLKKSSAYWVKYDKYKWKHDYLMPAKNAIPSLYNPFKNMESIVVDALNIGRLCMKKDINNQILKAKIQKFACKYGFLGLMTALPTTVNFIDYDTVYIPKNRFINRETIKTDDYLKFFFPFSTPDRVLNIENDNTLMAIIMMLSDNPLAVNMSFQRDYGERFDWLKTQFSDLAFMFATSNLYYEDFEYLSPDEKELYRQSMITCDLLTPTYHIELLDKPTLVWDFHSLLLVMQMMFSFMLTDENSGLKLCRKCTKAFVSEDKKELYCSKCKENLML